MAEQLIASLAEEFEPAKHRDTYREAVLELIQRKAAGEAEVIAPPTAPAAEKVIDLMAALEASVAAAKEARGRHPSSRTDEGTTRTRKAPAKKAAAKADGAEADDAREPARKAAPRKRKSA
jgi:DNA end-binding protein Ku